MTDQITAGTVPTVVAKRFGCHGLRIACPFCKGPRGGVPYHEHGTGHHKGPWHGHRLAHCVDHDLSPELREWRREHSLGYFLTEEVSDPRAIDPRSVVPNNVVERAAFSAWLRSRCELAPNVVELRSRAAPAERQDDR